MHTQHVYMHSKTLYRLCVFKTRNPSEDCTFLCRMNVYQMYVIRTELVSKILQRVLNYTNQIPIHLAQESIISRFWSHSKLQTTSWKTYKVSKMARMARKSGRNTLYMKCKWSAFSCIYVCVYTHIHRMYVQWTGRTDAYCTVTVYIHVRWLCVCTCMHSRRYRPCVFKTRNSSGVGRWHIFCRMNYL